MRRQWRMLVRRRVPLRPGMDRRRVRLLWLAMPGHGGRRRVRRPWVVQLRHLHLRRKLVGRRLLLQHRVDVPEQLQLPQRHLRVWRLCVHWELAGGGLLVLHRAMRNGLRRALARQLHVRRVRVQRPLDHGAGNEAMRMQQRDGVRSRVPPPRRVPLRGLRLRRWLRRPTVQLLNPAVP